MVTVAHIPGPLLEYWKSQSDRFAYFMTKTPQQLITFLLYLAVFKSAVS